MRIAEERERLSLTQAGIAQRTGVSREQWGKYERGINMPGGEVLLKASECGVDIAYVLAGKRDTDAAASVVNVSLLKAVIEAVETFLKRSKLSLAVAKKADLIALMYEHALPVGALTTETSARFLRLVG